MEPESQFWSNLENDFVELLNDVDGLIWIEALTSFSEVMELVSKENLQENYVEIIKQLY